MQHGPEFVPRACSFKGRMTNLSAAFFQEWRAKREAGHNVTLRVGLIF